MKVVRVLSLGLVTLAVLGVLGSAQNVSLSFQNALILRNVISNENFTVTDEFESAVTSVLNEVAGTGSTISASVYSTPPHLTVVSGAWANGTVAEAESQINSLNETYESWRDLTGGTLYTSLNELCMTNIGQQPSKIALTNSCSYGTSAVDASSATACRRSLTVSFLSATNNDYASLKNALCLILPTDCSLVNYTGTSTETIVSTVTMQGLFQVMSFTIASPDRDATLVTLVNFASYASVLASQNIAFIRVNGVQVYYEGNEPVYTVDGSTSQCVRHYWYLIFLIILVPVVFIASQRFYVWGRRSGRKSIRESEGAIRASLHISANPWGAYGFGGPPAQPGYGPAGGGGWQGMGSPGGGYGQWQGGGGQQMPPQMWSPQQAQSQTGMPQWSQNQPQQRQHQQQWGQNQFQQPQQQWGQNQYQQQPQQQPQQWTQNQFQQPPQQPQWNQNQMQQQGYGQQGQNGYY